MSGRYVVMKMTLCTAPVMNRHHDKNICYIKVFLVVCFFIVLVLSYKILADFGHL